jgi:polysaccharide export outer membrane protein
MVPSGRELLRAAPQGKPKDSAGAAKSSRSDPANPQGVAPEGYLIGAGDVLQIVVWREPDASVPDARVRVDGKISLPLVNDVTAGGLTPEELKQTLIEKLSQYINHPVVTVVPKEINSRRVYVSGCVSNEGPIPLIRPMTILQAINEAGGLGEWAKGSKIYVLRTVDGKQVKLPFDYDAVIKGKRLEQNIPLLPDDTIVVPGCKGTS